MSKPYDKGPRVLKPIRSNDGHYVQIPHHRCEHGVDMTSNRGWREHMATVPRTKYAEGRVDQCTRDAVVEIKGKNYCRQHGGQLVLDWYINGKLIDAD